MFHIGQKMVCINDKPMLFTRSDVISIVNGRIYTIRGIDLDGCAVDGIPGLWLEEVVDQPERTCLGVRERSYCASRFRPVRTTDISIFTAMLAPTPRVKRQTLAEGAAQK